MQQIIKYPSVQDYDRRLHSFQIPEAIAKGIVAEVTKWITQNGPEWTVKRLKALKTDFIQVLAGNGKTSQWIRYSRGVPAGAFGRLFRYGLKNRTDTKRLFCVLNALNSHTSFLALKETQAQLDKFYGALSLSKIDPTVVEEVYGAMKPLVRKIRVNPKVPLRTLKDYNPSARKRCPSADGKTVPETKWLETASCIWDTSLGSELYYDFPQLREVLNPIAKVVEDQMRLVPSWLKAGREVQAQGFAGKIGHIQEPGLKLRAVANPFRVYQLCLSRLGDQLYKLVESLPWDCTHDQDAGTEWSRKKLQEGHHMFAVDLSNATDAFPLALQIRVLEDIDGINPADISLLERLSTSPWLSPTHGLVTWNKGQPLGLYPSFALFTLTHGLLLRGLEETIGISDCFRVLGDDVVISHPELNKKYREVLRKLEVPVSEDKTLTSHKVTEFGGRVITDTSIISLGKWRRPSDRNFLDLLKNIGPKYLSYLPPRQRKVAERVVTLPPPIGFGWNPSGFSAETRWEWEEKLLHLYEPKYDLPHYGKQGWITALMNSEYAPILFDGRRLEGDWIPSSQSEARFDSKVAPKSIELRQQLIRIADLHKSIYEMTGVDISPSAQVSDLAISYSDLLVLSKMIAARTGRVSPRKMGDPRGSTTLELWEKRMFNRYNPNA